MPSFTMANNLPMQVSKHPVLFWDDLVYFHCESKPTQSKSKTDSLKVLKRTEAIKKDFYDREI